MRYGSVCSGIEAASVAWEPLGFKPAWFSEIEPFPCAVLAHHWPHVKNLGDMTKIADLIQSGQAEAPEILVGGTPCQAFSVAGLRDGLSDERGQLTLEFVRLANEIDRKRAERGKGPSIIVWENVPGILSSKDNAFGCFLAALSGEDDQLQPAGKKWTNAGYVSGPQRSVAWRILDSQYFGIAQNRRRVFVIASAHNGFDPAEILFEPESLSGDTTQSAEQKPKITTSATRGVNASDQPLIAATGQANAEITQGIAPTLTCNHEAPILYGSSGFGGFTDGVSTLRASAHHIPAIVISGNQIGRQDHNGPNGAGVLTDQCYTITSTDTHAVAYKSTIRRLMPIECERLQGFPDNHTRIQYKSKPVDQCPDSLRYRAIGNSMAVPVMRWIGERILKHVGG